MDIFDLYATDAKLEVEGRWVNLGKNTKVLVARAGNDNFSARIKHLIKKNGVDLKDQSKENLDMIEKLVIEATAHTILLGWEGLTYKGEALTYSPANAIKLLNVKDFRARIATISEEMSGYLVAEQVEQGNA